MALRHIAHPSPNFTWSKKSLKFGLYLRPQAPSESPLLETEQTYMHLRSTTNLTDDWLISSPNLP